jgi:formyltetrahydrofolate synthetase
VVAGKPLQDEYTSENTELVRVGVANLQKHIENARKYHLPVVVAVNRFSTDTQTELDIVVEAAKQAGAADAVVSNHWEEGGIGAIDLAHAVIKACQSSSKSDFQFLYPLNKSIKEKIEIICKEMYGAASVDYTKEAETQIERYTKQGFESLPICIAKTHLSFSTDPAKKNVPTGFNITVREIRASVGAGFLYPILGKMMTMPVCYIISHLISSRLVSSILLFSLRSAPIIYRIAWVYDLYSAIHAIHFH